MYHNQGILLYIRVQHHPASMSFINKTCLAYLAPTLARLDKSRRDPATFQHACFRALLQGGRHTAFGHDHHFHSIRSIRDFQRAVPVRDYDAFQPYIDRLRRGEKHVTWNQRVRWFAKSSGTSADKSKYIPVTPDNLHACHLGGFTRSLASYIRRHPRTRLLAGKALTLGGSLRLDDTPGARALAGDLSAILLSTSPRLAELARVPSRKIALMPDFREKTRAICETCSRLDVTSIHGVPSWNLVLINKLLEYNNARYLTDIWPGIELFMHGGIHFEPYREQFDALLPGRQMQYVNNYNASEGFFAFQDDDDDPSMLLVTDNGVFHEFIPARDLDNLDNTGPRELDTVDTVITGQPYALVISTNAGLWRYLPGDCIEFTSTYPHKIKIVGRTRLYINAFGEELMIGNAERALAIACAAGGERVREYTAAPVFMTAGRKGTHEWLVEFALPPADLPSFAARLDAALRSVNSDYDAKRTNDNTML
ncbi:MAG: GH3 auxin-responsive promoter family protein, partial [Odoribacteraceae bacterium]|nr:GH3 auxin-responsive promoter family protein [Odoribacteraceae bacterium]